MSANRSVQAAQRRRAGPSNNEPAIPGRSPQPSINSAQMFANQARPGSGPNIPTGRIAGQQAAMQQKQMQQQIQPQQNDKLTSVSKMTIPQAITLITLRLGAVESKLMNSGNGNDINFDGEHGTGIDPGFLQSILERLETVESRATTSTSSSELNLIKQQMETIKQTLVQTKNSTVSLLKEITALKTQIATMRTELCDTKELVATLQNITMENSQKVLDLSMGTMTCIDELNDAEMSHMGVDNFSDLQDDSEQNEIIGTDLKQLIENELNTGL